MLLIIDLQHTVIEILQEYAENWNVTRSNNLIYDTQFTGVTGIGMKEKCDPFLAEAEAKHKKQVVLSWYER